ncbi:MAG: cytochrome c5 [Pseudohongiellaceae bacterium]|jgi:cytochrome c5
MKSTLHSNSFTTAITTSLLFLIASISTVHGAESESFDATAKYQSTCFACHGTGAAHAPEVGDVIEWEIRLDKGLETLVQNTISGLNGIMPARGLCTDCSDDQLKQIVEYMLENSQ